MRTNDLAVLMASRCCLVVPRVCMMNVLNSVFLALTSPHDDGGSPAKRDTVVKVKKMEKTIFALIMGHPCASLLQLSCSRGYPRGHDAAKRRRPDQTEQQRDTPLPAAARGFRAGDAGRVRLLLRRERRTGGEGAGGGPRSG